MMYYFSTYFDINYLPKGLALLESLKKFLVEDFTLFVLALDGEVEIFFKKNTFKNIIVVSLEALEAHDQELLAVKSQRKTVEYFFTISPCLPLYLLERYQEIDMISQIDADIYFFQSPKILFDELGANSVLICSHNLSEGNPNAIMFGKYNVVFNTFRRTSQGLACLKWWRERCIEWCHDYSEDGKFADQKYLEQFPIIFNEVVVSQNQGVNVAIFNLDSNKVSNTDNIYKANDTPIVFYHFHRFRKLYSNLFDPSFINLTDYQNKSLIKLYIYYIKRLIFYEKKYKISTYSPLRYDFFNDKKIIKKKIIYEYPIWVSPIYSGVVHLEKYFKVYMKIKNLFLSNGTTT